MSIPRTWLKLKSAVASVPGREITLVSYNILAQSLIAREWFPYCSSIALKWKHRKKLQLEELVSFNADIYCLQEVDHYTDHWLPEMAKAGYAAVSGHRQEGEKKHGLAVFYKQDQFQVRESRILDLACTHEKGGEDNEDFVTKNEAQVVVFEFNSPTKLKSSAFAVTNTHLYWHTDGDRIRLFQSCKIIKAVNEILKAAEPQQLPVFYCGDYNATPDDAVYKLMTDRSFTKEEKEKLIMKKVAVNGESSEGASQRDSSSMAVVDEELQTVLDEMLQLPGGISAYGDYRSLRPLAENDPSPITPTTGEAQSNGNAGQIDKGSVLWGRSLWKEPEFTNYTEKFKGTLDYIVQIDNESRANAWMTEILDLPEMSILETQTALPNDKIASDHLMIACKICFAEADFS